MKPAFGFTHRYANAAVVLLFALVFVPLAARGSTSGVTYQGRILKPDGAPLAGSNVQFKLQIRTPDTNNCLMYEEIQALDMRNSNGQFALTINDGSGARTDSTSWGLDRIFANRGSFAFDPSTCASGSSYAPNTGDGRNLVVLFKDETMAAWEPIPAQKINFVPFAFEAKQVAGFAADSLLRVVGAGGDPLTGLAPLSNAQYTALLDLVNGSSAAYTRAGQLNGVALPTMSAGEVLGWNGSAWVSQAASGGPNSVTTAMIQANAVDSSKIATGAVGSTQIANNAVGSAQIANGAVGTSQIASNVSISTSGTLASAITTTRDFKIFAPSPSTYYVGMLADPTLAASYTLTWPLTAGSANQVLTTDGSGKLTWTSPSSAGITDLTGDVTATGPGSAAATVASVGGSTAALVHSAELAANAATALNTPNTIVKRDGSGGFAAGAVSATSVTSTGAVSGGSVSSSSTITATGAISGASVTASGAVSGATVTASGAVTQGSSVFKDSGANTATIQAPTTLTNSYVLKLPTDVAASNGQVLTSDTSGNLTWTTMTGAPTGTAGGDLTGSYPNPSVATVGTSTAANIHTAEVLANAATDANTPSTIVKRDASGNFSAGAISATSVTSTGAVSGGSVSSSSTITATGAISGASVAVTGAVTGASVTATGAVTQGSSVFKDSGSNTVTVQAPTTVSSSYILKWPTSAGGSGDVLSTDASGNLSWTSISIPTALPPNGSAGGDLTGSYPNPTVATVGTSTAANIHSAELLANAATDANTPNTIVKRDGSGNFSAGDITAASVKADALHLNNAGSVVNVVNPMGAAYTLTLPTGTGTNGQVLTTNGSGVTSWSTALTNTTGFVNGGNTFGATANLGTNDGFDLNIKTNNTTKMTVTVAGNVGIGTTSPNANLDVVGGNTTVLLGSDTGASTRTNNTIKSMKMAVPHYLAAQPPTSAVVAANGASSNVLYIGGGSTALNAATQLLFYTGANNTTLNGSERMRVDFNGNVGIGTTSPGYKLDVAGDINVTGNFKVNGVNVATGGGDFLRDGSQAMTGVLRAVPGTSALPGYSFVGMTGTGMFETGTDILGLSTAGSERVRILANGNVGIGTTNPSSLLTLQKDQAAYTAVALKNADPGGNALFQVHNDNGLIGEIATAGTTFYPEWANYLNIYAYNASSGINIATEGSQRIAFRTNDTVERMRINGDGKVGIGTTSPGALLDVKGAIRMSGATSGYTGFQPAAVAGSTVWTLPSVDGTSGQVLKTDGSGNLGWVTPAGAGVTQVTSANTDIGVANTTTTPVLTLNSGTGANQILKLNGSSQIPAVDGSLITNLNAGNIGSGTLPVSRGGTGATSFANYSVIASNGSGNQVAVPGSTSNTMLQWTVTGPQWSSAVWPSSTTANQLLYSSANNVVGQLATANNGVLVTNGSGVPSIASSLPSAVQGNITSTGTITSGTWNGTAVAAAYGGTGQTSYTTGDLLYASSASALSKLSAGTSGYYLKSNGPGTAPSWAAVSGGGAAKIDDLSDAISDATNLYMGASSGAAATSATYNTAVGLYSGEAMTTGGNNTLVGYASGDGITTQTDNVGVGKYAIYAVKAGANGNTAVGSSALFNNGSGIGGYNTGVGYQALKNASGADNTAIGYSALDTTSGNYNVGVGESAGSGSAGNYNIAIGYYAYGTGTSASSENVIIGHNAFYNNGSAQTAANNVVIGGQAAGNNKVRSGSNNVIMGYQAAMDMTSAANNVILGKGTAATLTTGASNILIGTGADVPAAGTSNYLNIGNTIYGNTSTGNVGIGTTSPNGKLDVKGSVVMSGATSGYAGFQPAAVAGSTVWTLPSADGTSGQVLKTDGSGNLGWVTPSGAGVTQVTSANTDIGVANTTTTPVLTLNSGTGANQILKLNASSQIPAVNGSLITNLNAGNVSSGTLPVSRGGTGATSFANYSVIASNASGNQVAVPGSTAGTHLQWTVTGPAWTTATFPATTTANQLLYSSAANTVSGLTTANNGVLITSGTGVPSISSTLPTAVQGNITSTGTITSGTWNGSAIGAAYGGTGQTSFAIGDLLYANSTSTLARLPASTSGYVLTSNGAGTVPSWQAASSGVGGSGTANYVPKFTAGTTLGNSAIYESSGNVGIGTTSPNAKLHVAGTAVLGAGNTINGTLSYAFGPSNSATSSLAEAIAIGKSNSIYSGSNGEALAFGVLNSSSASSSGRTLAFGVSNTVTSQSSGNVMAFGSSNTLQSNSSYNLYAIGDGMSFVNPGSSNIYMGTGGSAPTMTITSGGASGSVGIGTAAPNSTLQVSGSIATTVASKSSSYTVTASDSIITANASSGTFTVTLPTASGIAGRQYTIKKTDATANAVVIGTTSSQTIDGSTTQSMSNAYQYITVVSDGSNWSIIGSNAPSSAWPSGSYCIVQAQGNSCPSGFTATSPGVGQSVYGNSWGSEGTIVRGAASSSTSYTSQSWAMNNSASGYAQTWAWCCK